MRLALSLTILGFLTGSVAAPALAQSQQQQQQQGYVYQGGANSGPTLYNSGANLQMLPMQRMVAGQNAPSYNYGGPNARRPFGFNSSNGRLDPNVGGSLTPEQARTIRDQRNTQAAAYQQQYLESLRQRDASSPYTQQALNRQQAGSAYQGAQFNQLYNENNQPKPQTKRKVIYNQLNNPLIEPPRLFNPDQ